MTIGDDCPSLSDFPRVIPPHQCWRNGGVECKACDLEEKRADEEDGFCGLRCEGNVCHRPEGHSGACYDENTHVTFEDGWWADDRCTQHGESWTRPVNGAGIWQHTPRHRESVTDLLTAFLACLLGGVLLLGLIVAGRSVMCQLHDGALSYCSGYTDVSDGGQR